MVYSFKGFIPVIHESSFVHPQAAVTGNVIIGKDCYIGPGAAIRGDWGAIILEDGAYVPRQNYGTEGGRSYWAWRNNSWCKHG